MLYELYDSFWANSGCRWFSLLKYYLTVRLERLKEHLICSVY